MRRKQYVPTEDFMKGYIKQIVSQRYRDTHSQEQRSYAKKKFGGKSQFYDSLLTGQEKVDNKIQSQFRLLPFEPMKFGDDNNPPNKNKSQEIDMNEESLAKRYALQAFKSTPNFIFRKSTIFWRFLVSKMEPKSSEINGMKSAKADDNHVEHNIL